MSFWEAYEKTGPRAGFFTSAGSWCELRKAGYAAQRVVRRLTANAERFYNDSQSNPSACVATTTSAAVPPSTAASAAWASSGKLFSRLR